MDATGVEAYASKVRGCLLGGAVGDALGAPVEFASLEEIWGKHGPDGVRAYAPSGGGGPAYGAITDDTQMTLFTVEGLIRARVRTDRGIGFTLELVHASYDRWLDTQTLPGPPDRPYGGWLATETWLYSRRAPGDTCLSSLSNARAGTDRIRVYGGQVINRSKGCGAVMRSAPFGLLPRDEVPVETAFEWADEAAGWTHGHPSGRLCAGALAAIVAGLVDGLDLPAAVDAALAILRSKRDSAETVTALEAAVAAGPPRPICGNILGTRHGAWAVPPELAFEVEGPRHDPPAGRRLRLRVHRRPEPPPRRLRPRHPLAPPLPAGLTRRKPGRVHAARLPADEVSRRGRWCPGPHRRAAR
jgi:ADP-ribosylglycohydrolase